MNHLHGLSVLVLGLGESGLAMARWCARFGATVQVWDSREQPPQAGALRESVPGATLGSGALDAGALDGVDLVLKSPGLAPHDARIAPLLAAARERGTAIANELDLFSRALAELKADRGYAPRVLAVTGTNGKTTTTAMCSALVARCGLRVAAAGNIGPTMLDTLGAALDLEPAGALAGDARTTRSTPAAGADTDTDAVGELIDAFEATEATEATEGSQGDDADEPAEAADATAAEDTASSPVADARTAFVAAPAAPLFQALPEVWVLELSSFQLDGVQGFEPGAAAVLNISQDHLDWHGDMAAYTEAKSRVFGQHAVMVVNRDDPQVEAMVPEPVLVKGGRGRPATRVGRTVVRFGPDAPRHPGDFGLVVENGMAWLVRARQTDPTVRRRKDEPVEIALQRLMPADALRVRGRHNAANALAALALATAVGCPLAPMLHGLREYAGEPHRLQFVASVADVEAYDDSKGTNVGATVAALDGLGADKAPARLVVILGGDGKGQDFGPLAAPVARHVRAVALIGRDADALALALRDCAVPMQRHDSLQDAVAWGFGQARPGDALLLSPACASLDMFRNYAHRAEVFVAAVHEHAASLGEALT